MTALATELNRTAKVEMRVGMRIILTEFAAGAAAAAAIKDLRYVYHSLACCADRSHVT